LKKWLALAFEWPLLLILTSQKEAPTANKHHMNQSFPYPAMPEKVDERIMAPSAAFKREIVKVAGAIAFFAVVYVALMAAALALAVLSGFGGYFLVLLKPSFLTLMLGFGLAGLGGMVIFFLLKFIFTRNKTDRSGMTEIQEDEQPELFAFIRRITQETQTPFPKKIYLSAEVNAAVFYDSSFWSMFFPVKKNLVIGLGLVNSVNITEFKAILAHEFGHFSQRSMKLGSYVYNVNRAIHNMLYENEGYAKTLDKWSNLSGYFALFAGITVKIVQAIQWVLKKAYVVVNKPYMSLSRQMEFHADSVAAFVAGSEPLITSLRRIEAADICYARLFEHYNSWFSENLKADNLYQHHRALMHRFSADLNIPLVHGLPQISGETLARFHQSRLVVKDQWASHPSTDDRETHLVALNVPATILPEPAWVLFREAEKVQQQMTEKIYHGAEFSQVPEILTLAAFSQKVSAEITGRTFDKAYKGYYDNRILKAFEVDSEAGTAAVLTETAFEDLFTDAHCQLPEKISHLENDIQTVQQIISGDYAVKTFDFDGRKYKAKEAVTVQQDLELELEAAQGQLDQLDKKAFGFFYRKAEENGKGAELLEAYRQLFQATEEALEDTRLYQHIFDTLKFIFTNDMTMEGAKTVIGELEERKEPVKLRLQQLLQDAAYTRCLLAGQGPKLERLATQGQVYFSEAGFDSDALTELNDALALFIQTSWEKCFQLKKEMLSLQMMVLHRQPEEKVLVEER
jgi:Zn-dependent protease with chaperone function